jgi:ATP-binding cassette subfamily F protein 3
VLGSFLFTGDAAFKSVSVLSGGEKSRLALVKLLLDPPNLLLMDEPTTHLDVGSIDALIGALQQYHGTLIFISHDVHFIRRIATSVLHINGGRLTPYPGDYDYYLDKSKSGSARAALTAGSGLRNAQPELMSRNGAEKSGPGLKELKEQKRREAEERKGRAKAERDKAKQLAELEMQIATLEGQQKELTAALEDPAAYEAGGNAVAINRDLAAVCDNLERLNAEWEKATSLESASQRD